MIRRRDFLGSLALPAAPLAAADRQRPNILYIMTDQQHAGMLSCAGNRWVKTPAMDSLAAAGVRFELAYSSNPVCMPARTSMMTGRYPNHFHMRSNEQAPVPREELTNAMGNLFRRAGYRTLFGGKTHWPKPMTPETLGFEYISRDERNDLAGVCAESLRSPQTQPFLLIASFINPHDICYMAIDAYTRARSLPPMYPQSVTERRCVDEASQMPPGLSRAQFFEDHCPPIPSNHRPTLREPAALGAYGGFRGYVRKHWSDEDWRLHRWAYCRLTERVDAEIARVLAALRETGLDRNTVVVFSSDHGDMDAAHGFEHKSLPYEESARVPFIVSWPGHTPRGRVDRTHLVSSCTDLLPTLCDYAGIDVPAGLPGRSVRALAEGRRVNRWRSDVIIECSDSRCVRTSRYKYSRFSGAEPRDLLIDMQRDPGETVNLAPDPSHSSVLASHQALLRRRMDELGDEWGKSLFA
jgi:choline-sulfatase